MCFASADLLLVFFELRNACHPTSGIRVEARPRLCPSVRYHREKIKKRGEGNARKKRKRGKKDKYLFAKCRVHDLDVF